MSVFQGSNFRINLPDGCVDASTYAFVIPRKPPLPPEFNFNPSIVIKFDPRPEPVDLLKYVVEQRSLLRDQVENFEIINETSARRGNLDQITTVFEWGLDPVKRFRQKQFFAVMPQTWTVCSITATELAFTYSQSEPMFDRIFESFIPLNV
jgi:hypothetical protein